MPEIPGQLPMFVLVDDGERVASFEAVPGGDRPALGHYLPCQLTMDDLIDELMAQDSWQLAFVELWDQPFPE